MEEKNKIVVNTGYPVLLNIFFAYDYLFNNQQLICHAVEALVVVILNGAIWVWSYSHISHVSF